MIMLFDDDKIKKRLEEIGRFYMDNYTRKYQEMSVSGIPAYKETKDHFCFEEAFAMSFEKKYFFVRKKGSCSICIVETRRFNEPFIKTVAAVKGFEKMTPAKADAWEALTNGRYIESSHPSVADFWGKSLDEIGEYMFDQQMMEKYASSLDNQSTIVAFDSKRRGIIVPSEYYKEEPWDEKMNYPRDFKKGIRNISRYGFSRIEVEKGCSPYEVTLLLKDLNDSCEFLVKYMKAPQNLPSLFGTLSIRIIKTSSKSKFSGRYSLIAGSRMIELAEYSYNCFFHEFMHAFDVYYSHISGMHSLSQETALNEDDISHRLMTVILGTQKTPSVMVRDAIKIDEYVTEEHQYRSLHNYYQDPSEILARAFTCYMTDSAVNETLIKNTEIIIHTRQD